MGRLPANPFHFTRRAVLYGLLVLLALVFVPLIVTSGRWLRASRIDLTTVDISVKTRFSEAMYNEIKTLSLIHI